MGGRFQVRMPEGSEWYDLWHTHVDWRGEGNRSSEGRRVFLRLLFDAWGQVEALAGELTCPWQSWLVLDADDSSQDAVFLHTPNPNRDNFPYPFDGVTWGAAPPTWLAEFVAGKGVEVGTGEYGGATLYWVRRATR